MASWKALKRRGDDKEPLADFVGRRCEGLFRAKFRVAELEAVARAARAYERAVRAEVSFRERGKLFGVLTDTLNVLDARPLKFHSIEEAIADYEATTGVKISLEELMKETKEE